MICAPPESQRCCQVLVHLLTRGHGYRCYGRLMVEFMRRRVSNFEIRISKFLYRRAHALPLTLSRRNEWAVSRNILGGHTSQKYRPIEIIQEINEVKHVRTTGPHQRSRSKFLLDPLRRVGGLALDNAHFGGLAFMFGEDKHPRSILQKEFSLRLGKYPVSWPLLLDE
jgi:hypothetical protein